MKIIQLLLAGSLFLSACNNKSGDKKEEPKKDTATAPVTNDSLPKTGSDRDEHGCIGSAGYTWSVVKNECIRIFEAGTRMDATEAVKDKNFSAFAVFSGDEKKAELFIPGLEGNSMILESVKPNQWSGGDWSLEKTDKGLVLKKAGVIQYTQQAG